MSPIIKLGVVFIFGVLMYLVCFIYIIHKPMTIGNTLNYFQSKRSYLETLKGKKKIIILAGSNGRFSHRCETIEKNIGIPCANLSIAADIDLNYQFMHYSKFISQGDLIYMPLEYPTNVNDTTWSVGLEGPLIARYEHEYLRTLGGAKFLTSLFYFDMRFILSGAGEMALNMAGKKRRFSVDTLTLQGDERGHNLKKSEEYRDSIRKLPADVLNLRAIQNNQNWVSIIKIISWAKEHGVLVVGGLPTVFDDIKISNQVVDSYKHVFIDNGQYFLLLENKSQYPREMFYDTGYHLREEGQILHSTYVSKELKSFFLKNKL